MLAEGWKEANIRMGLLRCGTGKSEPEDSSVSSPPREEFKQLLVHFPEYLVSFMLQVS